MGRHLGQFGFNLLLGGARQNLADPADAKIVLVEHFALPGIVWHAFEHDAILLVAALPAECEQVLARAGFFDADDSKDSIKSFEYVYGEVKLEQKRQSELQWRST